MHFKTASNDNQRFVLTAVDVVSRKGFARPIPSKAGVSVGPPLGDIIDENGATHLQTDKGKEFYNQDVARVLERRGVKHFSTDDDEVKASMVERFNRTLREKMYRYFTKAKTKRFIDVLPQLVESYNKTIHSSTGIAPANVTAENQETAMLTHWDHQAVKFSKTKKPKLEVGFTVRLSNRRTPFTRGYTPRWTRELFTVAEVEDQAIPVAYRVDDMAGERIEGLFYEAELQRVDKPDIYEIDEILKQQTDKRTKKKKFYVKWLGYPDSFNSWVDESELEN